MSDSVIAVGDKLHIMTRRLFEEDVRRHFAGQVLAVSGALVEVEGYTFIFHPGVNEYRRLPELRTRVFSIGEAAYIVNKIPRAVDVETLGYLKKDNRLVVTDGGSFSLAINEFSATN